MRVSIFKYETFASNIVDAVHMQDNFVSINILWGWFCIHNYYVYWCAIFEQLLISFEALNQRNNTAFMTFL